MIMAVVLIYLWEILMQSLGKYSRSVRRLSQVSLVVLGLVSLQLLFVVEPRSTFAQEGDTATFTSTASETATATAIATETATVESETATETARASATQSESATTSPSVTPSITSSATTSVTDEAERAPQNAASEPIVSLSLNNDYLPRLANVSPSKSPASVDGGVFVPPSYSLPHREANAENRQKNLQTSSSDPVLRGPVSYNSISGFAKLENANIEKLTRPTAKVNL